MRGPREPGDCRGAPNGDAVAGAEVVLLLPVERKDRRLVLRLELEHHVWRGARQVVKFVALGTAVGFDRERAPESMRHAPSLLLASGAPFTSDLTGPDFVALLRDSDSTA